MFGTIEETIKANTAVLKQLLECIKQLNNKIDNLTTALKEKDAKQK